MSNACNSYAYLINENLIVKFAKDEEKLNKLFLEKDVLSFLKDKTTLKIPQLDIFKNDFYFSIHEIIRGEIFLNKHYPNLPYNTIPKSYFELDMFKRKKIERFGSYDILNFITTEDKK